MEYILMIKPHKRAEVLEFLDLPEGSPQFWIGDDIVMVDISPQQAVECRARTEFEDRSNPLFVTVGPNRKVYPA